jgi:preprotein translocase subunit Sss1
MSDIQLEDKNRQAVRGLIKSVITPLLEDVLTQKLTQIMDVAIKKIDIDRERYAKLESENKILWKSVDDELRGDPVYDYIRAENKRLRQALEKSKDELNKFSKYEGYTATTSGYVGYILRIIEQALEAKR